VKQDAYTLHRHVMLRFTHNPYSVDKLMVVWECDLLELESLAKYNDMKINYIGNRRILENSASGSRKEKERPFHRLGVSVHISRQRIRRSPVFVRTNKGN
jgi:hypothetical protein